MQRAQTNMAALFWNVLSEFNEKGEKTFILAYFSILLFTYTESNNMQTPFVTDKKKLQLFGCSSSSIALKMHRETDGQRQSRHPSLVYNKFADKKTNMHELT